MERVVEGPKHEASLVTENRGRVASPSAAPLPPALAFQQLVGNQAMQQLVRSGYLHPKLAISSPDDPEETEADNLADNVMRKAAAAPCSCSEGEEMCEECRQKQAIPSISRRASAPSAPAHVPRIVSDILRSPGHPLDFGTRAFFEPRFGRDFSNIRIHTGADASASARSINAHAYTAGSNIVFASGQYAPDTTAGRSLLAHELAHTIQQPRTPLSGDVDSLPVSSPGDSSEREAKDVSNDVVKEGPDLRSGVRVTPIPHAVQGDWIDDAKSSLSGTYDAAKAGLGDAYNTVASTLGNAASTTASVVSDTASSITTAAGNVVQSAAGVTNRAVSWLETQAGKAAVAAASALASALGGKVTAVGTGIVIEFPDIKIADVEDETFVLPLGIPVSTIFEEGTEVGTFVINAWAGQVIGDPEITVGIGPARLQNVKLLFDPLAGTYAGTAQLFVGSATVGAGAAADEVRLEAAGVIPIPDAPIPIVASADAGFRTILRLVEKENFFETVTLGYSGGTFLFDAALDLKLGVLADLDHELFLRVEIETDEVCSLIWPISSTRLADDAVEINLPLKLVSGPGGVTTSIGKPTAKSIPVDTIETVLKDNRPPEHCLGLTELIEFLCHKGKLPPDVCALFGGPTSPGGGGTVPTTPSIVPLGGGGGTSGGGGGGGGLPPSASAPTGLTPGDPIEMDWYKHEVPHDFYPSPISVDGHLYSHDVPDSLPRGEPIGVPRARWHAPARSFNLIPTIAERRRMTSIECWIAMASTGPASTLTTYKISSGAAQTNSGISGRWIEAQIEVLGLCRTTTRW